MKKRNYKLRGKVFLWGHDVQSPWHFVSVPRGDTGRLNKDFGKQARGWRSLPVEVRVGRTVWKTSVFYDSRSKTYILPLKKAVKRAEKILVGDNIKFSIKILV